MEDTNSLEKLFSVLKQRSKMIIIFSMFGLLISSLYSTLLVTPKYESASRLVVNQIQNTSETITNNDIQTNLNLINTYKSIIQEPIILEDVIKSSNSNLTVSELRERISVQIEVNSLVFGIKVNDENPYIAAELANVIALSFQNKIGEILEVESVTILSEAIPNLNAVSPNISLNLAIGLIIGFMVGVALAYLTEFFDKRVKDSKIIEDLGWTNLGSVLEMSNDEIKATRIDKKVRIQNSSPSLSRRRV